MFTFLYTLIIYPIMLIIEVIYTLVQKIFGVPGISIAGVSVAVTLLCLPLYIVAEKWQKTERAAMRKLAGKARKIRQAFKGDEQHMILSTYYRQNHYHPIYALRSSFGILIQVPFFIAAYQYISHLEALQGASFLFIRDLGKPDALLSTGGGGVPVNILPILMTFINIISGAVYTKDLGAKDKIQLYGMAAVFLALLYNSPAGLVLYWTMNNVLSLCKNIFYRLKNPQKMLYILAYAFTFIFIIYLLFINDGMLKKRILLSSAVCVIFFTPFFIRLVRFGQKKFLLPLETNGRQRDFLFFAGTAVLAILTGIAVPASVIVSSPDEFSFIDSYTSPLPFIFNTLFKSAGLFLFWPACVYFLFGKKIKALIAGIFLAAALFSLINCFVFSGDYSTISNTFLFDSPGMLSASRATTLVDILCGAAICAVCLFVLNAGKINILNSVMGIVFVSLVCFSTYNVFAIQNRFTTLAELKNENSEIHSIVPIFSLSKGYPNIVIIMADKAINGYVKPIFEEHPELNEQFDGFTLFPNTLSFSGKTITGVPPLWGGYEYTPKEMNARNSIPLVKKHNEALLLLPTILSGKGYQIAVTDPSWANYDFVNDTSIYNHLDNVKAFNTIGRYTDLWYLREDWKKRPLVSVKINRNAAWFSFLKTAPLFLRKLIYDDGRYWECDARNDSAETFVDSYAVLDFLPTFTKYDVMQPSAILLTNETAHNGLILQVPEYKPVEYVTNTGNGEFSQQSLYHANNAVYLRIGAWFDELKKNGVYDNTRIIIVSDHGSNLDAKITDTDIAFPNERRETYNPVLLFKDFNAHGKLKTDNTFMTNADVPVLALSGIAELVNPFTGKALTENHKKDGVYIIMNSIGQPDHLNRNTFKIKDDDWLFVKDNIFDAANWTKVKQ